MEFLNSFLPIVLYIVAIILLIILIMVGLRLLRILDRIDVIVDNVEEKINSFNGAIQVFSKAATGIANFSDSVVFGITNTVSKIFHKKKKEEDRYYE